MDQNIFIRNPEFGYEVNAPGKPKPRRAALKPVSAISLYSISLIPCQHSSVLGANTRLRTSPSRKEYASNIAAFYRASQGTSFSLVSLGVLIKLA